MIQAETAGRARDDITQRYRETSGKRVQKIKGVSGSNIRRHQGHLLMRSQRYPDEWQRQTGGNSHGAWLETMKDVALGGEG